MRLIGRALAIIGALAVVALAVGGLFALIAIRRGVSARTNPSRLEELLALQMRSLATPSRIRNLKNPLSADDKVLALGRHHFADHCAVCHANDGSGDTEMGKNMYPKAPDFRMPRTQNLTDGELYGIIQNGIRLTGMPAWGQEQEGDQETWALVAFIRHLPRITPAELREMEKLNPKTPGDASEQDAEQRFLQGGEAPSNHGTHRDTR